MTQKCQLLHFGNERGKSLETLRIIADFLWQRGNAGSPTGTTQDGLRRAFSMILQWSGANVPHFALWVDNPEFSVKVEDMVVGSENQTNRKCTPHRYWNNAFTKETFPCTDYPGDNC